MGSDPTYQVATGRWTYFVIGIDIVGLFEFILLKTKTSFEVEDSVF